MMKANRKLIMYVEDDPDDREFFCEAIRKEAPAVEVIIAENGLEALDRLLAKFFGTSRK